MRFSYSALLAGVLMAPAGGGAAEATAQLGVALNVSTSCEVTAFPIDFGILESDDDVEVEAEVVVRCSEGLPFFLDIDGGLNAQGVLRQLTDGAGNFLPYVLEVEGKKSGNGLFARHAKDKWLAPGQRIASVGNGAPATLALEGRILKGRGSVPAGRYVDTVTVTLQF